MTSSLFPSDGAVGWTAAVMNAISDPQINGFRLTLTSGTPVTTSDVSGASAQTIYLSPYTSNRISLYDGTNWAVFASAEVSKGLGTLTSGKNYDVFVYDNNGTLTIDDFVAWTDDTTRATALVQQDGAWVKSGATTRRYVGTFRTASTTATEDSAARRFLWNESNRVRRHLLARDDTNTWTYTTAAWRSANNNTTDGVGRVSYVVGQSRETVSAAVSGVCTNATGSSAGVGVGLDSVTVNSGWTHGSNVGAFYISHHGFYAGPPGTVSAPVGYHFLQRLEIADGNGTMTWAGDLGLAQYFTGLVGEIWA